LPGVAATFLGPFYTVEGFLVSKQDAQMQVKAAGMLSNFRVDLFINPPGANQSWTFRVHKQGGATGLECQINTGTTFCIAPGAVAFEINDFLSIEVVPFGFPPSLNAVIWRANYN
jgi:hypothetical protein